MTGLKSTGQSNLRFS